MNLSVKLYRIESQRLKSSEIYYLVKDVRLGDTAAKVRVKLGYIKPHHENEMKLTTTPSIDLE